MKRHSTFVMLSRDHHDGLLLATRLQQGTKALLRLWSHDLHWQALYVARFFDEHLDLHFKIEEEVLFPRVKEYLPAESQLVDRLLKEHQTMGIMVESFRHPTGRQLGADLSRFGAVLEQHIRSEERELFPKCEETFTEDQLEAVGKQIRTYPHEGGA